HVQLATQVLDLFTNEEGTFGVFPQVQIGGETGSGGGVRVFHTDLFGKRKIFTGYYIYSGHTGQTGDGLYLDPNLLGSGLYWKTQGAILRTRNRSANINAPVREDSTRLFRIDQGDVETLLGWRKHRGRLAPYLWNATVEAWFGFGRRDFRALSGGGTPLNHAGVSPDASLLRGLDEKYDLYRFGGQIVYDDRDYKAPVRTVSHPLHYKFPGRVMVEHEGLFYSFRDLGYPERGGLVALEGEMTTGSGEIRFYRFAAELQRYVTLFWRNRILAFRGRVEKVRRIGDGFVPYTELVQLGGSKQMRGYRRGYLRGQGTLMFNVEYRYPIWDTWNAFLFWDEGQVFDHFNQVGLSRFRTSWGGGISLRSERGMLMKIQAGHSVAENLLLGISMEQDF
ncbi:MAG: BamA/TamA family outer membrane protein, partial [bacterium]|nr:BamA/TamA family outer membrane protein [bacterium]